MYGGSSQKKYIYHERQESLLCGQHCLNNLMQGPFYNAVELSQIALELDRQERQLAGKALEYHSANVDDSGNFSIQVLKAGLGQRGINLEPWFQRAGEAAKDPTREKAFIVNRSHHWYTIRRLHGEWWNLNSSLDLPEPISSYHLTALFTSLKVDGYSIFAVTGNTPEKNDPTTLDYLPPVSTGRWYEEKELHALLNGDRSGPSTIGTPGPPEKKFQAFEGKANRLDGKGADDADLLKAIAGAENDEELQIALAISASLQQTTPAVQKVTTKEDLRAKRLAALSKGSS